MAFNSLIPWTHHSFNGWIGCTKVGPDCEHCYAEHSMDLRFHRAKWGPGGTRVRTSLENWRKPYSWNRLAERHGTKFLVFGDSCCDFLEDREEVKPWRAEYCEMIQETTSLVWIMLTKRPVNFHLLPERWQYVAPDNVWFGVSAGDQQTFGTRSVIFERYFGRFPVRILSLEPLLASELGPIVLGHYALHWYNWVLIGGESGDPTKVRPFDLDGAREVIKQCRAERVPVFVKQMGSVWAHTEKTDGRSGRTPANMGDPKGENMIYWPQDLRIREWPPEIRPFLASAQRLMKTKRRKRR